MKFDELDARMRVFETAHDHCVLRPQVLGNAPLDQVVNQFFSLEFNQAVGIQAIKMDIQFVIQVPADAFDIEQGFLQQQQFGLGVEVKLARHLK